MMGFLSIPFFELKNKPEAKSIEIWPSAVYEYIIQVIVSEEVKRPVSKLEPDAISDIMQEEVISVSILLFITAIFKYNLSRTTDSVSSVPSKSYSGATSTKVSPSSFSAGFTKI